MGRERRLRDRARNNAAGFHANFSDSDIDNVSHFIDYFTFDLHGTVLLAAHQFVAHGVEADANGVVSSTRVTSS